MLDCVDKVRELAAVYELREVMFDPWRFGQAAQELERERVVVTAFPQTDSRMIPSSDRLYRAVVEKRLTVPDDAELRQQVANTIARRSRLGWRLDKPSLDTPNIIALCMALEALENSLSRCRLSDGSSHALPRLRPAHAGIALRGLPGPPRRLAGAAQDHQRRRLADATRACSGPATASVCAAAATRD